MLFIDDYQPQVMELNRVTKQSVGTHHDASLARRDSQFRLFSLSSSHPTGQKSRHESRCQVWAQRFHNRSQVLSCEHLSGGKQSRLSAILGNNHHCPQCHHSLTGAHFALNKAVHRVA